MLIKQLRHLGFHFKNLPSDVVQSVEVLGQLTSGTFDTTNQKTEVLDNAIFESIQNLLPNNALVKQVQTTRPATDMQNDGFNTDTSLPKGTTIPANSQRMADGGGMGTILETGLLLAPNGKPSKLTKMQWEIVRTKNFKIWFGNWDRPNAYREIVAQLTPFNIPVDNWTREIHKDTTLVKSLPPVSVNIGGKKVLVTKNSYKHINIHAREDALFFSMQHIKPILENLKLFMNEPNTKRDKKPNIESYDNYIGIAVYNGIKYWVRATVQVENDRDNILHDLNLVQQENTPNAVSDRLSNRAIGGIGYKDKAVELFIQNKFSNISKVTDENGEPMVLFHGTKKQFNVFDINHIGNGTGNYGHYGYGFYLSDDIREAKVYGPIVKHLFANARNPFINHQQLYASLKKNGIYWIDDTVPLSIEFDSLYNEIKKRDDVAANLLNMIHEHGYEKGWSVFLENNDTRDSKLDLNDINDIYRYTEEGNGVPDQEFFERNFAHIVDYGNLKFREGYAYDQSLHWITQLGERSREVTDVIKKMGYDGIVAGSEYVLFNPNQIKLADSSNTAFDPGNADIRMESGGPLDKDKNNLPSKKNGIKFVTKNSDANIFHTIRKGTLNESDENAFKAIANHLRKSNSPSKEAERTKYVLGKQREEAILTKFAEANGLWLNYEALANLIKPYQKKIDDGIESIVYLDNDQAHVVKTMTAFQHENWFDLLNRLIIYNDLFYETMVSFVGFTNDNNSFSIVLKQRFVESERGATEQEMRADMKKNGYGPTVFRTVQKNDIGIVLRDLHDKNVLVDNDGQLAYIDVIIQPIDRSQTLYDIINSPQYQATQQNTMENGGFVETTDVKYAYKKGDKVIAFGPGGTITHAIVQAPSNQVPSPNGGLPIQAWLTSGGYMTEDNMLPEVVSAKKVSGGQVSKPFKKIPHSSSNYEVVFADGKTYRSYRATERDEAIQEAMRQRLHNIKNYPKTETPQVRKEQYQHYLKTMGFDKYLPELKAAIRKMTAAVRGEEWLEDVVGDTPDHKKASEDEVQPTSILPTGSQSEQLPTPNAPGLTGLPENEIAFVAAITELYESGKDMDKRVIERIGKENNITYATGDIDQNHIKELTELATVLYARKLAHTHNTTVRQRFDAITKMYRQQANLNHRTTQSILYQQYSTPAPVAYMAGVFCGFGDSDSDEWKEFPETKNGAALSVKGDYVISHRPNEFTVSYRPEGAHKHIGTFETLDEAKAAVNSGMEFGLDTATKFADGGHLGNPDKNSNFEPIKTTKHEINIILSGKGKAGQETLIGTTAGYLGKGPQAGTGIDGPQLKEQETARLRHFIEKNSLWVDESYFNNYLGGGAEQDVYLTDGNSVLKTNNLGFYSGSWPDYLASLILHNFFFPDTAYELIGFAKKGMEILPVVKQPFVEKTSETDLGLVKEWLGNNGFKNTKNNDYYNAELDIILEDLHDENVLTKDGILYFVDTAFYIKANTYKAMADGGTVSNIPSEAIFKYLNNWIDKSDKASLQMIDIRDTNWYPTKHFIDYSKNRDFGFGSDVKDLYQRIMTGEPIWPIVVEKSKCQTLDANMQLTDVEKPCFSVRDGIHRIAIAEDLGIYMIPALVYETNNDRLTRDFEGSFKNKDEFEKWVGSKIEEIYTIPNSTSQFRNPTCLEASAGNGMLTIAGLPKDFIVNELDKVRNAHLQAQGYAEVTKVDASEPFPESYQKHFKAVITNPPFGSVDKNLKVRGMPITKLEHLMAAYALECMRDDGRCAIIIGGNTKYTDKGIVSPGADRNFLSYLHYHYNVADLVNIDGSLYSRMGTSFNVRLILINGRKPAKTADHKLGPEDFPPPMLDDYATETFSANPVKSFEDFFERMDKVI